MAEKRKLIKITEATHSALSRFKKQHGISMMGILDRLIDSLDKGGSNPFFKIEMKNLDTLSELWPDDSNGWPRMVKDIKNLLKHMKIDSIEKVTDDFRLQSGYTDPQIDRVLGQVFARTGEEKKMANMSRKELRDLEKSKKKGKGPRRLKKNKKK